MKHYGFNNRCLIFGDWNENQSQTKFKNLRHRLLKTNKTYKL